jgi:hypothetical protein
MTNCEFLEPVRWSEAGHALVPLNAAALRNDTWNWSKSTCTSTDPALATSTEILIQNPETGASFYLSPTLSYMDFYWFVLSSAVLIFWIVKILAGFLKRFFFK